MRYSSFLLLVFFFSCTYNEIIPICEPDEQVFLEEERERVNAAVRKWQKENREKVNKYQREYRKRKRAEKLAKEGKK